MICPCGQPATAYTLASMAGIELVGHLKVVLDPEVVARRGMVCPARLRCLDCLAEDIGAAVAGWDVQARKAVRAGRPVLRVLAGGEG